MSGERIKDIELMAQKLRREVLEMTTTAGSGHPTSCLSCAEIMSCLFFSQFGEEDEFILSKGHAAPILWAAYAEAGLIKREELQNLRKIGSQLEGHPTPPLVKVASGSLGQGLSAGVGMALAMKLQNRSNNVYVLLGDGECAEGSVWEAANSAAFYRLNNLCAVVDVNRLGQSQETMHGRNAEAYRRKFEAFGWEVAEAEGHHVHDLLDAFEKFKKSDRPFVILAQTIKGKGISFLENKEGWHGKSLSKEELKQALAEIGNAEIELKSEVNKKLTYQSFKNKIHDFSFTEYQPGQMVATRDAFGKALVNAGRKNKNIIALDGDVENSTMLEYFFKAFPERSFECFIAEQNMVGMALGCSTQGLVPVVATFSAFLTRAHDFIRMALYSRANIKFVGSHAGVSIGQDGPSQMGLEDIGMFLSIPESLILYPSDARSAEYLVGEMLKHQGISYLRTTREKLPVLYTHAEKFPIGGFKILKKSQKDKVLIIGAGITVHEALKAHAISEKKNIAVRIIDLYSVQPLDVRGILKHARESRHRIIVVEDHYQGGIGSVVANILAESEEKFNFKHLYVKEIPRSGKPDELLQKYGIDAKAIVKEVVKMAKG